jgi:hypothetical protein
MRKITQGLCEIIIDEFCQISGILDTFVIIKNETVS